MKKDIRINELKNIEIMIEDLNTELYFIDEFGDTDVLTVKEFVARFALEMSTLDCQANAGILSEIEINIESGITLKKSHRGNTISETEIMSFSNFDTCEFAYYNYMLNLLTRYEEIPSFVLSENELY